jgi:diguanylate cyclase (GGDEF)-like protein
MPPPPQLIKLLHGISSAAPGCFFDSLARELTEMLDVEFAFVAELIEREPLRGRTIAFFGEGRERDNMTFRLANTPCNEVLEHGYRFVASNVRSCFPQDTLFQNLNVESYAGIALVDQHAIIGWLAVMSRRPFADESLVRAVLEFIAARATAELRARVLHEALAVAQANALRDGLTSLPNRAHFLQQVEVAIASARPFSVLFLDLDRFKVINDSLGHLAGDALLRDVSLRIRASLRPCDIAARLGGDEFAVLLDGASESDAIAIANEMSSEIAKPFGDVYTSASIGIACSRGQYTAADEILRDADTAMYRAKAAGKARAEVFDNVMHVAAVDRLCFEMDLRRAIERRELSLVYQDIVTARDRRVAGREALLRWTHATRGMIMPGTFIPIAEETGAIVPIGEWVLDRVCRDITRGALGDAIVNVNLSAMQLQQHDFVQRVDNIVRAHRVLPRRVRLEVTETAIAADPESAARSLHAIKNLGIQLCIDDFGIGYSSLASLLRLPFTSLKIDRSLIAGITTSIEHREMVAAIALLARNLHIEVVAEGVETAEQLAIIDELGIEFVQGFYVATPSALQELVA